MPLPFYFQIWTEEGYLSSASTLEAAKRAADNDQERFGGEVIVYRSNQGYRRPPTSTAVYNARSVAAHRCSCCSSLYDHASWDGVNCPWCSPSKQAVSK